MSKQIRVIKVSLHTVGCRSVKSGTDVNIAGQTRTEPKDYGDCNTQQRLRQRRKGRKSRTQTERDMKQVYNQKNMQALSVHCMNV